MTDHYGRHDIEARRRGARDVDFKPAGVYKPMDGLAKVVTNIPIDKTDDYERRLDMSRQKPQTPKPVDLTQDSGLAYLEHLEAIAAEDAAGLKTAQASYGNSWKSRGGVGAFMMLARKWDRLHNRVEKDPSFDIFKHIASDTRAEGIIDDVRDLRRYLLLVESEMRARGFQATHRDNA